MTYVLRLGVAGVLCFFAVWGAVRAETLFFTSIQDVPLMTGLEELGEQAVMFDKPEGRIMEVVASMNGVSEAQVRAYYESSLPSFGWIKLSENSYSRSNERLSLLFEDIEGHQFLRVMIAPN